MKEVGGKRAKLLMKMYIRQLMNNMAELLPQSIKNNALLLHGHVIFYEC